MNNIEHSIILDKIATFFSAIFIYISLEDADHFVHMIAGMVMLLFWIIRVYEKFSGKLISDVWKEWRKKKN